jgi:hypothetical protein
MAEMIIGKILFLAVENVDLVETMIATLRFTGFRQVALTRLVSCIQNVH